MFRLSLLASSSCRLLASAGTLSICYLTRLFAQIERDPVSAAFSLQPELCAFAISRGSALTLSATLSRPPSRFSRNFVHLLSHEALRSHWARHFLGRLLASAGTLSICYLTRLFAHIERDLFSAVFSLPQVFARLSVWQASSIDVWLEDQPRRPLNTVGHEVPSTFSMHCDMRNGGCQRLVTTWLDPLTSNGDPLLLTSKESTRRLCD